MTERASERIVVADTSVLINLLHVKRLELLSKLPGYDFLVTDEVIEEVTVPEQAEALYAALDAGHLSRVSLACPAELELFAEHARIMGRAEASCLAVAEARGFLIACDERRTFLRVASERLGEGRMVNTSGIFVLAIRSGILTVEEADHDKHILERHKFKMSFASFKDVI